MSKRWGGAYSAEVENAVFAQPQEYATSYLIRKFNLSLSHSEVLEVYQEEREKIVKQTATQLETEKNKAISDIKAQLADMVINASEKILKAKLDSSKDKELIKDSLQSISK
jgi:F0F1-type ATP synthase membrane subunit b/b'